MSKPNVWDETAEIQDANILSGKWKESGSNLQTLTFYMNMINYLRETPYWDHFKPYTGFAVTEVDGKIVVSAQNIKIHDWGCGFGNGTAVLQVTFPGCDVVGYDHSKEVLKEARYRWPTLLFKLGDINNPMD